MSRRPFPDAPGAGGPAGDSLVGGAPLRRRTRRLPTLLTIAAVIGAAGTGGTLIAAREAIDSVARVAEVDGEVLSDSSANVENFLLVGSDSRANVDPTDPDFGGIGDESTVSGRRSDTIMVLRRDLGTGTASLLSIPRDLWVEIPGHGRQRINAAYTHGPDVLVQTVEGLGIPVHHYIEIDFSGFKSLVDAIGGYQHCSYFPARDVHTGFFFPEPGCAVIDGVQALAFARSRYYEEYKDPDGDGPRPPEWQIDGRADIGRTERQRQFVKDALQAALTRIESNPFVVGDVLSSAGAAIRADEELDLMAAVTSLRDAVADIATYALPVRGTTIDGNAVLEETDEAAGVIAYFRGDGPPP